jgi:DNA repair exonuclease SbcCD ATPase subunit
MISKKLGFIVKINAFLNKVKSHFFITAYADEKDDKIKELENQLKEQQEKDKNKTVEQLQKELKELKEQQEKENKGKFDASSIADLLTKARKDEREKLYPKIDKLEKELKELKEKKPDNNKDKDKDSEIAKLQEEIAKLQKGDSKSETNTTPEIDVEKIQKEIAKKIEKQNKDSEAKVQKVIDAYEVKLYRSQKINELQAEGKGCIPELIMGETKEEIDASIELSTKRYEDIAGSVVKKESAKVPFASPNLAQLTGSMGSLANMSEEQIRNMSPEEWSKARAKMGLK